VLASAVLLTFLVHSSSAFELTDLIQFTTCLAYFADHSFSLLLNAVTNLIISVATSNESPPPIISFETSDTRPAFTNRVDYLILLAKFLL
jgi:hypothetical protein